MKTYNSRMRIAGAAGTEHDVPEYLQQSLGQDETAITQTLKFN